MIYALIYLGIGVVNALFAYSLPDTEQTIKESIKKNQIPQGFMLVLVGLLILLWPLEMLDALFQMAFGD